MRISITRGLYGPALILVLSAAVSFGVSMGGCSDLEAGYSTEISEWRAKRLERLRSPTGYLALAGLYWFDKENSTFGSDPSNDFVFATKSTPAFMGSFQLKDGVVRINVRSGVDVLHDGEPVRSMTLHSDQDPDHDRTMLEFGTLSWWVIKRGDRLGVRLRDAENALRFSFEGVENYATDSRWRIEATFERHDPLKFIPIENEIGIVNNETSPGELVFEIDGESQRLDVLGDPGDEDFFVIFADETNGLETYGAGRFLYVDAPGKDGNVVVVDFNKAYNPPCAFSDYTTCPLPPPQNRLPIRVTAGEKSYKK